MLDGTTVALDSTALIRYTLLGTSRKWFPRGPRRARTLTLACPIRSAIVAQQIDPLTMFESLAEKLQGVFKRLRYKGALTEQDVADALREVRLALLEADVNIKVAKDFTTRVKERAVGGQILEGLNAAQQVVKIVNEELTALLGG